MDITSVRHVAVQESSGMDVPSDVWQRERPSDSWFVLGGSADQLRWYAVAPGDKYVAVPMVPHVVANGVASAFGYGVALAFNCMADLVRRMHEHNCVHIDKVQMSLSEARPIDGDPSAVSLYFGIAVKVS